MTMGRPVREPVLPYHVVVAVLIADHLEGEEPERRRFQRFLVQEVRSWHVLESLDLAQVLQRAQVRCVGSGERGACERSGACFCRSCANGNATICFGTCS